MATNIHLRTFSELYTELQNRVRVQTGVTAVQDQSKRYINLALQDMHIGHGETFPWCERSEILLLQPRYATGTLAVTQGATALTGTSTLWNTANAVTGFNNMRPNGKIVISGSPEVYTISSISSDTAAVLTSNWIDATETAATYRYFEDEVDLSADFLRPIDYEYFDANRQITLINRNDWRRRYTRNNITGKPKVCMVVDGPFGSNTVRVQRLIYWQPATNVEMIRYHFVTNKLAVTSSGAETNTFLSDDADEPIVPEQYRMLILFHALYHWYLSKKDDTRWKAAKADYDELFKRIFGDMPIARNRPQIQPNIGHYLSRARAPYRGRGVGRRYDVNARFDRLE